MQKKLAEAQRLAKGNKQERPRLPDEQQMACSEAGEAESWQKSQEALLHEQERLRLKEEREMMRFSCNKTLNNVLLTIAPSVVLQRYAFACNRVMCMYNCGLGSMGMLARIELSYLRGR